MASARPTARELAARYRENRARSAQLFALVDPAAYYEAPIALRNPIVFYEGHLPAFSVLAFLRRGLGREPIDARLETIFERGIDPESVAEARPRTGAATAWPARDEVAAFARACDQAVLAAIEGAPAREGVTEALYTALEHEQLHHETLLYMWHELPPARKRAPRGWRPPVATGATPPPSVAIAMPAGRATLGARRDEVVFGWDNEFEAHEVEVPAFEIDELPVTNAAFLEFVRAGGYAERSLWDDDAWAWIGREGVRHPRFWRDEGGTLLWRGMFADVPLPLDWPAWVSHAEASAYARFRGRRLPTEAEHHRAAEGATPGNVGLASFDPVPVTTGPASRWGVRDLVGNGWEWTSTVFTPFPGFRPTRPYPEYSTDFFDGRHLVLKGASPATPRELVRPSFRNWFRPTYPFVFAKFRTAA